MRQAVRTRRYPRRSSARAPEPGRGPEPQRAAAPAPARWPVAAWAVVGCVVLYGLLAWQVAVDGPVRGLDERAGPALARHAPAGAELLADLGGVWAALPVLAAATLYAAWRTRLRPAAVRIPLLAGVAAFAVLPAVVLPLKSAQARPGPKGPLADDYAGFFPSGHATTAAVAYGAAVLLLLPLLRSRAARRVLVAAAGLVVPGAGAGLVWREYHWPLDVLAGWCVAGVLLAGGWYGAGRLTAYAAARVTPDRSGRPGPQNRPVHRDPSDPPDLPDPSDPPDQPRAPGPASR